LDLFFSPQKNNDQEKNDSIRNLRDLTTDQQRKKREETENQKEKPLPHPLAKTNKHITVNER